MTTADLPLCKCQIRFCLPCEVAHLIFLYARRISGNSHSERRSQLCVRKLSSQSPPPLRSFTRDGLTSISPINIIYSFPYRHGASPEIDHFRYGDASRSLAENLRVPLRLPVWRRVRCSRCRCSARVLGYLNYFQSYEKRLQLSSRVCLARPLTHSSSDCIFPIRPFGQSPHPAPALPICQYIGPHRPIRLFSSTMTRSRRWTGHSMDPLVCIRLQQSGSPRIIRRIPSRRRRSLVICRSWIIIQQCIRWRFRARSMSTKRRVER